VVLARPLISSFPPLLPLATLSSPEDRRLVDSEMALLGYESEVGSRSMSQPFPFPFFSPPPSNVSAGFFSNSRGT